MAVATTYVGNNGDTANASSYTFTAEPIGSASADRIVVVGITSRNTSASTTISSVTIGGVTATIEVQVANSASNYDITGIAALAVSSGTTADIVVTFTDVQLRCGLVVYTVTGANGTPYATNSDVSDDPSLNINIPAAGGCIAVAHTAANTNCAWTGLTENADFTTETFLNTSAASDDFVSAQTPLTVLANFSAPLNSAGCSISYQEAAAPAGNGLLLLNQANSL